MVEPLRQATARAIAATALVLILSVWAGAGNDFPLRETYPDTKPISTEQLTQKYGRTLIVDVRSGLEYGVIRIKGARHIPVAKATFIQRLHDATGGEKDAAVAFYCNGHTCAKSYKAAARAMEVGYTNATVYDAGIFEWTTTNPDKSWLMGASPVDTTRLIPDSLLDAHSLHKDAFASMVSKDETFVIDARDPIQIKKTPDFGKKAASLPFDRLTENLTNTRFRERMDGKILMIYDAVGKQVRWLQYHLEDKGFEDYYFLENGVWSIYGEEGAN